MMLVNQLDPADTQVLDVVDAHHHLWNLDKIHYPWLMARGVSRFFGDPTPIQHNYLVSDFLEDVGDLPVARTCGVIQDGQLPVLRFRPAGGFRNPCLIFDHPLCYYCELRCRNHPWTKNL